MKAERSLSPSREKGDSLSNISRDQHKLIQRGLQVLSDFSGDHVRIGEIGRILQALVLQPENIQADFVTFQQVFVSEGLEAL